MTEQSNATEGEQMNRWLIILAAALSSSTLAFTGGCAVTRLLTDSLTTQLWGGLLVTVLFVAVMLLLVFNRHDNPATPRMSLSDLVIAVVTPFGMATMFFPLVCPEAAELLKQHISLVMYDAIRVAGIMALVVFVFLFWMKLLGQLKTAKSSDEM